MIQLINTHNRPHSILFGDGAFYDLDSTGHQEGYIKHIRDEGSIVEFKGGHVLTRGQPCVVISIYESDLREKPLERRLIVEIFEFDRILNQNWTFNGNVQVQRVFHGTKVSEECMTRKEVQKTYPGLFSTTGHFKQCSVVIDNTAIR